MAWFSRAFNCAAAWARRHAIALFIVGVTLLIAFLILWPRMAVTVGAGEAGVLFHRFGGTVTDRVFDEGLHVVMPWDVMYIYNVRLQTVERQMEPLSSEGLPVKITAVIRFRADKQFVAELHTTVGPDYVQKIVVPQTEAVLRRFIGQYTAQEIYTTKRGLLDAIVINSLSQSERHFVVIDDVLIKSVVLPPAIKDIIESKLVYDQSLQAYPLRLKLEEQEAARKRIEAAGIRDYQKTIHESLDETQLRWQGILATRELAASPNAKVVVIGSGKDGLPLILGKDQ